MNNDIDNIIHIIMIILSSIIAIATATATAIAVETHWSIMCLVSERSFCTWVSV